MAGAAPTDQAQSSGLAGWLTLETRTGQKPLHRAMMDNWQSGVTVALVSVPLSISLGIASVAGDDPAAPTMGVSTAFWGGISAGLFGSSDLNIVGPAGALSGMLNSYTIQYNGSGVLPYISIISSVMIFLIWMLNLQGYLLLMPKAVFEGFTMAVAVIIGLNQLNMAFDLHPKGPKHVHFYENVIESLKVLDEASAAPTIFFFVTTALLLGLMKYFPKIRGISIPWTVFIPVFTILIGYLSDSDKLGGVEFPTLKGKFGELHARVFEPPTKSLDHYADGDIVGVLSASLSVAFVAVLETLISAKIAEQKVDWPFNDAKETLGLAISHLLCGISGSLPPTGVFVRTSLNTQLGATHRISQIMNAIVVLIISVIAMPAFSYLPQASVAALLIFASIRMAPVNYVIELWRHDKGSCALLIVTTLICVFTDPVYGLVIGMVVALLRDAANTAAADSRLTILGKVVEAPSVQLSDAHPVGRDLQRGNRTVTAANCDKGLDIEPDKGLVQRAVQRFKRTESREVREAEATAVAREQVTVNGAKVLYEPIGPVVYLAADRHLTRLQALLRRKPETVVISLQLVTRADVDGASALGKAVKQLQNADVAVELVLPEELAKGVLGKVDWVAQLREKGLVRTHRAIDEEPKADTRPAAGNGENQAENANSNGGLWENGEMVNGATGQEAERKYSFEV